VTAGAALKANVPVLADSGKTTLLAAAPGLSSVMFADFAGSS